MNVLNQQCIDELIKHRSALDVSLFLSTYRAGRERQQNTIRWKNLINEAGETARSQTHLASLVEQVLQPAKALQFDTFFWRNCSDGLACFCAPDFFRAYRVPIQLDQRVYVNTRFYIKPLLPLLRSDARLYVLALTQESARLFETTRYSTREIGLTDVAPVETNGKEKSLQLHSHRAPSRGGSTDAATYHGPGGATDRAKDDAVRFFQLVDRAVTRALRGQQAPLVLACVGFLAPLYESANSYGNLIKGKVPGSPDRWSEVELRDHAWMLAEPHFRQQQREAWNFFQQASNTGRASDDLRKIVSAADQGRVDTLFLVRGAERWESVDTQHNTGDTAEEAKGAEMLDYAAVKTLTNGGNVFLMDSLRDLDAPAAATFRY